MNDTDMCGLSGVPDDAAPRIRDCFECSEPVPAERPTSVFCSLRCSNRNRKRRHREYETVTRCRRRARGAGSERGMLYYRLLLARLEARGDL